MAFTSLRKQPPPDDQPEQGEVLEDQADDDNPEEDQQDGGDRAGPGFLPALLTGLRGWWAFTSRPFGTRGAYTAHAVALWAAAHYGGWILTAVVLVLGAGIGLYMPPAIFDRAVARIEHGPKAPREPGTEEPTEANADPLITVLWTLIGNAPGTHLKTLTHTLAQAARKEGRTAPTKDEVEAALTTRGITLRPSVRDTRDKVNKGVHREDLEAWQSTPSPAEDNTPAPSP